MNVHISNIPRVHKAVIAKLIHQNLEARAKEGPAEPALDAFIPELAAIAKDLETHVQSKATADAAHAARALRRDRADIEVDTHTRHIECYLGVEATRREGPHVAAARLLYKAAFPRGMAFVDARIPDENATCREMLAVLRHKENEATLQAIRFPMSWLDDLQAALVESDAAFAAVHDAKDARSSAVERGRDAEADWMDAVVRLRKYVDIRARAGEMDKRLEGRALIAPLLDAIANAKAKAATRATARAKAEPGESTPAG